MAERRSAGLALRCATAQAVAIVALVAAGAAEAQTPACEQLKTELAARIDATGARGYALESVPAGTPVPAGAKSIGSCEAGRYKVLYRRWAAAPSSSSAAATDASDASQPAAVAQGTAADRPARRSRTGAEGRSSKPAAAASEPPAATTPPPAQSVAPPAAPAKPAAASIAEPVAQRPAPRAAETAPPTSPSQVRRSAEAAIGARASETLVARVDAPAVAAAPPAPSAKPVTTSPSLARRATDLVVGHWPWLLALVLLPLGLWLYSRWSYHRAYDEAGLPRGPRL